MFPSTNSKSRVIGKYGGKTFFDDSDAQQRSLSDSKNDEQIRNTRQLVATELHSSRAARLGRARDKIIISHADAKEVTSGEVHFDESRPVHEQSFLLDSPNDPALGHTTSSTSAPVISGRVMLHLMRVTKGRMQGSVAVRSDPSSPWQPSYCSITRSGALRSTEVTEGAMLSTLMRDIRGCEVWASNNCFGLSPYLQVRSANRLEELQLLPEQKQFSYWFAAFLCWQPASTLIYRPKKSAWAAIEDTKGLIDAHTTYNRTARVIHSGDAMIIEPSTMKYTSERRKAYKENYHQSRMRAGAGTTEMNVRCLLHDDGTVVFRTNDEKQDLATVMLKELPKSAIQRVDKHVFKKDRIIAIYPQYASSLAACSRIRPIFLSFASVPLFETYFVLLRAFALPEVYLSQPSTLYDSTQWLSSSYRSHLGPFPAFLRQEASLNIQIGKITTLKEEKSSGNNRNISKLGRSAQHFHLLLQSGNLNAEILVDEQTKTRMSFTGSTVDPSWNGQCILRDLSASSSTVTILLRSADAAEPSDFSTYALLQVNIPINHSEHGSEHQLWPVVDCDGSIAGYISIKLQFCREHILPEQEYAQLLELLMNTSNGLTLKIWRHIHAQSSALAEIFVNVFQSSGKIAEWFKYLATEEIGNGPAGNQNALRGGRDGKTFTADSPELEQPKQPEENRQKTAVSGSSVLFRGNSFLTKALEVYLRRKGASYLEATLGPILRRIMLDALECEVDPSKLPAGDKKRVSENWTNLFNITEEVWTSIYDSRFLCPRELKVVLRHIRETALHRFGHGVPNIVDNSVSAFIFLRFFCAAIVNPLLFGLVEGNLSDRVRRTCLLIAKSIQGLANTTSFGAKESWMSPMNTFYSTRRQEFTNFINCVCDTSDATPSRPHRKISASETTSSAYDSALLILEQLSPSAHGDSLTLPFLIDRARNLAAIVELWMKNFDRIEPHHTISEAQTKQKPRASNTPPARTVTLRTLSSIFGENACDGDIAAFHSVSQSLAKRTEALAKQATTKSSPSREKEAMAREDMDLAGISQKWVGIAERLELMPEEFLILD